MALKVGLEMNGQKVENGIYQSLPHGNVYCSDRDVYIQDGSVRLVYDDCCYVFAYDFFFKVNKLGGRIGDLPKDFNIQESPYGEPVPENSVNAAQLIFEHHQKLATEKELAN